MRRKEEEEEEEEEEEGRRLTRVTRRARGDIHVSRRLVQDDSAGHGRRMGACAPTRQVKRGAREVWRERQRDRETERWPYVLRRHLAPCPPLICKGEGARGASSLG